MPHNDILANDRLKMWLCPHMVTMKLNHSCCLMMSEPLKCGSIIHYSYWWGHLCKEIGCQLKFSTHNMYSTEYLTIISNYVSGCVFTILCCLALLLSMLHLLIRNFSVRVWHVIRWAASHVSYFLSLDYIVSSYVWVNLLFFASMCPKCTKIHCNCFQ